MSDEFDDLAEPLAPARGGAGAGAEGCEQSLRSVPHLVAQVYAVASQNLRVKLLDCLLRPVGPLGLVAIAAGAFGSLLQRGGYRHAAVSIEDATAVSPDQFLELAHYVEQSSPDTFLQVAALLNDNAFGLAAGVSASLLVLLVQRWRHRGGG